MKTILALGAHYDDIEIGIAGTLLFHAKKDRIFIGIINSDEDKTGDPTVRYFEQLKSLELLGIPENNLITFVTKIDSDIIGVLDGIKPDIVYVDASDVSPERFSRHIAEELPFKTKIVSRHKADKTYPVVSAASIIAKVERDRFISILHAEYGDFGSGYASDSKTIKFLKEWGEVHGDYPDFVRKSWAPAKKIKAAYSKFQKRLF